MERSRTAPIGGDRRAGSGATRTPPPDRRTADGARARATRRTATTDPRRGAPAAARRCRARWCGAASHPRSPGSRGRSRVGGMRTGCPRKGRLTRAGGDGRPSVTTVTSQRPRRRRPTARGSPPAPKVRARKPASLSVRAAAIALSAWRTKDIAVARPRRAPRSRGRQERGHAVQVALAADRATSPNARDCPWPTAAPAGCARRPGG